jgi:hypothetical protein
LPVAPEPVYLHTYLYFKGSNGRAYYWQASNPFGPGSSPQLKTAVVHLVKKGKAPGLESKLKRFLGDAFETEAQEVADLIIAASEEACKRVVDTLGENIKKQNRIYQALAKSEQYWLEIKEFEQVSRAQVETGRLAAKIESWYQCAYKSIETILSENLKLFPPGDGWQAFPRDPSEIFQILIQMAMKIGLTDIEGARTLLSNIPYGRIRYVVEENQLDMQGLLAAHLIAADLDNQHPFYQLAKKYPNWLSPLAELKSLRDGASHTSFRDYENACGRIADLRKFIYQTTQLLIPGLKNMNDRHKQPSIDSSEWSVIVLNRLRQEARFTVEKKLTWKVIDHVDLKLAGYLTQMEENMLFGHKLQAANSSYALDLEHYYGLAVLNGCRAVERVVTVFLCCNDDINQEYNLQNDYLSQVDLLANNFGFSLSEDSRLPETLRGTKSTRVQKTIRYRTGTLGALTLALFLTEELEEACISLGRELPDFIHKIEYLLKLRGHGGNDLAVERSTAEEATETVYQIVISILKIIYLGG